jgi:dihydrofolate synthase/folylpolyglutamate synthase
MDYLEALSLLCQPIRAADYPHTLSPMRALLAALDNPQQGIPAVVVAGSTGKGTTCHHIARLLHSHGLSVGLYTSPHLHSFRERFVLDNQIISKEDFVAGAKAVRQASAGLDHVYSTFEQATALALWWFARQKAEIMVLEIGLGGRWDAVNAIDNVLAVFTRIETEHAAMLGGSLGSIAWHKAGIIRPDGHAITVKQAPEAYQILQREAKSKNAHLHLDGGCNLSEERSEALLALAAWQNLLERGVIPRRHFQPGLCFDGLPGRMERVQLGERRLLIDGGHTPESARRLRAEIARLAGATQPARLIVGMLGDKAAHDYLRQFDSPRFHVVLTRAPGHRAATPDTLLAEADYRYATAEIVPLVETALEQAYSAPETLVVITGSLRVAASAREYFGLLSASELAEAQATRSIFDGADYLARLRPMPQTGSGPAEEQAGQNDGASHHPGRPAGQRHTPAGG